MHACTVISSTRVHACTLACTHARACARTHTQTPATRAVVCVCVCAGFGGQVSVAAILEFVDSGRNLLLAANSDVSDTMRTLAAEVGVDMDDKGTRVLDHFSHQQENAALVASWELSDLPSVLGAEGIKVRALDPCTRALRLWVGPCGRTR